MWVLLVQTPSPERRQRELWAPLRVSLVAGREGRGSWGQAGAAGTWGEGCQEPGCLLKCRQMAVPCTLIAAAHSDCVMCPF